MEKEKSSSRKGTPTKDRSSRRSSPIKKGSMRSPEPMAEKTTKKNSPHRVSYFLYLFKNKLLLFVLLLGVKFVAGGLTSQTRGITGVAIILGARKEHFCLDSTRSSCRLAVSYLVALQERLSSSVHGRNTSV